MVNTKVMPKTKIITKLLAVIAIAIVGLAGARLLGNSHAASLTVNVNMNWVDGSSSCYGTANGQTQAYYGAIKGDSVNVHITNVSTYSINLSVYGTGLAEGYTIPAGGTLDKTWTANMDITLENNGGPCTSGHGGPGVFYIYAATGSISCSLSSNQVWTIRLGYNSLAGNTSLYRGGIYVEKFNVSGSSLYSTVQFAATTSATTYKLYYGSTNSSRLLGQTTCPAKTATAATSTPKTTTSSKTTKSAPANPSNSSPAATTSNSQNTTSDNQTNGLEQTNNAVTVNAAKKKTNWNLIAIPIIGIPVIVIGVIKFYPKLPKFGKKR
ncbi:MAG: hypothetical protein ACXWLH_03710 [Candidatus Saccharimonadales bacterium]